MGVNDRKIGGISFSVFIIVVNNVMYVIFFVFIVNFCCV